MFLKVSLIVKFVVSVVFGILSYSRTPFEVGMEYKIPANQTDRVCVPAEENPLHFFEDRIVTMTASHEHFSVKPLDKRSNVMNAFLSIHQSSMIPDLDFFGHYLDAKRDGSVVRVVITPYRSACYEFLNEDAQSELDIDTHIRTVLCWQTLLLELFVTACIFFVPSSWKYLLLVLLSLFFLLGLLLTLNSSLLVYAWYANTLFVPIVLPLLRVCCKLILIFLHAALRHVYFMRLVALKCARIIAPCKEAVLRALKPLADSVTVAVPIAIAWVRSMWKEIGLAIVAVGVSLYVFIPSKINVTVYIRLGCVICMMAAIAFVDYHYAIWAFFTCGIVGILLLVAKDTLKEMYAAAKRLMQRRMVKEN